MCIVAKSIYWGNLGPYSFEKRNRAAFAVYKLVRNITMDILYFLSAEKGQVTVRAGVSREKRQRHTASLQLET